MIEKQCRHCRIPSQFARNDLSIVEYTHIENRENDFISSVSKHIKHARNGIQGNK